MGIGVFFYFAVFVEGKRREGQGGMERERRGEERRGGRGRRGRNGERKNRKE
jgi:hypothetical protein